MSRENPYSRLKRIAMEWASSIAYPVTKFMWRYPKAKLNQSWSLGDLYERTKAADQLGYDVKLFATDEGLEVKYVKRPNHLPWELR